MGCRARPSGVCYGQLEARLEADARQLFCQLMQDHLDLWAAREQRIEGVVDATGVARGNAEAGHRRGLATAVAWPPSSAS